MQPQNLYLGIDQSKRSTAAVLLDKKGTLIDYTLINEPDDEVELIITQWFYLTRFIRENICSHEDIKGALIEGLAFGAVGGSKDFLAGLQWYFRARMRDDYGVFLGTVPVSKWRAVVLDKAEQREAKAAGKDGLKQAVVNKLPEDVRSAFADYVEACKDRILLAKYPQSKPGSRSTRHQEALYDLADAYFIADYCRRVVRNGTETP